MSQDRQKVIQDIPLMSQERPRVENEVPVTSPKDPKIQGFCVFVEILFSVPVLDVPLVRFSHSPVNTLISREMSWKNAASTKSASRAKHVRKLHGHRHQIRLKTDNQTFNIKP